MINYLYVIGYDAKRKTDPDVTLLLYVRNNKLVLVCLSNHMTIYYTENKGVVDDYHRSFVN